MLECSRLYHRNEDNHFWLIFNGNLNAIVLYISFINEMTHAIYVWFSFFLHIDKIRFNSEVGVVIGVIGISMAFTEKPWFQLHIKMCYYLEYAQLHTPTHPPTHTHHIPTASFQFHRDCFSFPRIKLVRCSFFWRVAFSIWCHRCNSASLCIYSFYFNELNYF